MIGHFTPICLVALLLLLIQPLLVSAQFQFFEQMFHQQGGQGGGGGHHNQQQQQQTKQNMPSDSSWFRQNYDSGMSSMDFRFLLALSTLSIATCISTPPGIE